MPTHLVISSPSRSTTGFSTLIFSKPPLANARTALPAAERPGVKMTCSRRWPPRQRFSLLHACKADALSSHNHVFIRPPAENHRSTPGQPDGLGDGCGGMVWRVGGNWAGMVCIWKTRPRLRAPTGSETRGSDPLDVFSHHRASAFEKNSAMTVSQPRRRGRGGREQLASDAVRSCWGRSVAARCVQCPGYGAEPPGRIPEHLAVAAIG